MIKNITSLFLLFFLVIITISNSQEVIKTNDSLSNLNDGPYVFIEENQLIEKSDSIRLYIIGLHQTLVKGSF